MFFSNLCMIDYSLILFLHLRVCISGDITAENARGKNFQREMDSMINDLQNVLWFIYLFICLFDCCVCVMWNFQFLFLRFIIIIITIIIIIIILYVYIDCLIIFFNRKRMFTFNWNNFFDHEKLVYPFYLLRRITCRKGEVQGRQRRTRYDIERIVGLLNNEIYFIEWWRQQQQQHAFLFFFKCFPSFFCLLNLYDLYVNLDVRNRANVAFLFIFFCFYTTVTKQWFSFFFN